MKRGEFFQKKKNVSEPSNSPDELAQNVSKKNPFRTNYSSIFSAKVQNLAVFSFIYMIRIRFFGPQELIQNGFRAGQYDAVELFFADPRPRGPPRQERMNVLSQEQQLLVLPMFVAGKKTNPGRHFERIGPKRPPQGNRKSSSKRKPQEPTKMPQLNYKPQQKIYRRKRCKTSIEQVPASGHDDCRVHFTSVVSVGMMTPDV